MGQSYASSLTTFKALETISPSNVRKVVVLLGLLTAMYLFAIGYTLRDLRKMRRARSQLAEQIWTSEKFQNSCKWLRRCGGVARVCCLETTIAMWRSWMS